jgi:hypothetical protein
MIELFQRVTYLQIEGSDLQGIICKELEIEDLSPEVSGDDSGDLFILTSQILMIAN